MPLKSATLFSGFLNQPSACGLDGCAGHTMTFELEVVLVEVAPHLEAAADVEPAEVIHVIHAEGASRRPGEQRRRRALADPVVGDGVPAVEHLLVGGVEHLERRHDLPGGERLDLHRARGQLVDALGEDAQVVLDRQARGPGRLHLQTSWFARRRPGSGPRRRRSYGDSNALHLHGVTSLVHPRRLDRLAQQAFRGPPAHPTRPAAGRRQVARPGPQAGVA